MRIGTVLFLLCLSVQLRAQRHAKRVYTITADSVKITNCDSSELIIENHTQGVPGFLFNTGNGRTVFQRGAQQLANGVYLIGADTLYAAPNAWLQGGNSFGTAGVLGTLDNNPLTLYSNDTARMQLASNGHLLIGTTLDNGSNFQLNGNATVSGSLTFPSEPSTPQLQVGTAIFQNYGLSNSWWGDNIYFDGSSFRYLYAGVASMSRITGSTWVVQYAPSGAAGAVAPIQNGLAVLGNGDVQITGPSGVDYQNGRLQVWADSNQLVLQNSGGNATIFSSNPSGQLNIKPSIVGIGINVLIPTAQLHLPAGTDTAGRAPLKFTAGTNLTTPEDGAIEFDGTHFSSTQAGTRRQLDQQAIAGSYSQSGSATTTFTVTIGTTQSSTAYKVNVTPTSSLSAAAFYVTNKTTTSFDVVYLSGLTGTVTFDWAVFP
jgi:hypothetical protein